MFLVMGITGKVGGATARHLLTQGKKVRALVRDRAKAASWTDGGVELVEGDWNDAAAIERALKGIEGTFVMLPSVWAPSPDYREAKSVIANYVEALTRAAPPRVVALSSIGANRTSGLGMITALSLLEQGFRDLTPPVAFVRAGGFFENFLYGLQVAQGGTLPVYYNPTNRKSTMVATNDIGEEVATLLQATYLGFIGSVPIPELDYLLCDDFVIPREKSQLYKPIPMAIGPVYQVNDPNRQVSGPLNRADLRLPTEGLVLCNFSNHYKITEEVFSAWMEILRRLPSACLWLAEDNVWSEANLKNAASKCGIDETRIVFTPRVAPEQYMAQFSLADLYLDTFPYNSGTVASDALRMALPLVTLQGEAFASRMAARLLRP